MTGTKLPLVFVQLNEINFDIVRKYVAGGQLPAFRRLLSDFRLVETFGEPEYECLEPWIQWVSAQTGLTYPEHRVFRLGDIVETKHEQIFERLEQLGLKVGAISPMNARNDLRDPAYFVPDPWTQTNSDASPYSRRLTEMLRQTVNENSAGRISARSVMTLLEATARSAHWRRTPWLAWLVFRSLRRPWLRSLVLDTLIHNVHLSLMRAHLPDASFVFLNAGAHVQHHYMLNSPVVGARQRNPAWYVPEDVDPLLEMLQVYDALLSDYVALADQGARLICATGLTQVPYERLTFYYRLRRHGDFLRRIGVRFGRVLPRMTRDFEIQFETRDQAVEAMEKLRSARMESDREQVFGAIEDRGLSLFVTLTYPYEIQPSARMEVHDGVAIELFPEVVFVAVKNGQHSPKGFAFFSPSAAGRGFPAGPVHVAGLFDLTLSAAS